MTYLRCQQEQKVLMEWKEESRTTHVAHVTCPPHKPSQMDSMTHPRGPFIERLHNVLFCKLYAQVRGHIDFYRKGF